MSDLTSSAAPILTAIWLIKGGPRLLISAGFIVRLMVFILLRPSVFDSVNPKKWGRVL